MRRVARAIHPRNACSVEIDVLFSDPTAEVRFGEIFAARPRPIHRPGRSARDFLHAHSVGVIVVGIISRAAQTILDIVCPRRCNGARRACANKQQIPGCVVAVSAELIRVARWRRIQGFGDATAHAGNAGNVRQVAPVVNRVDFAPAVFRRGVGCVCLRDAIQQVVLERRVLSVKLRKLRVRWRFSEKVTLRHPVLPIGDGLSSRFVFVHRGELTQRNRYVSALPADEDQHVGGAVFFWCQPPNFDGLSFSEWGNHFGSDAFGLERKVYFVFQIVIPAHGALLRAIRIDHDLVLDSFFSGVILLGSRHK